MAKRIKFGNLTSGVIVPVLVIGALAVAYFVVWPKYQGVQDRKASLENKKAAVTARRASVDSVKNLVAELEQKRSSLAVMDEALPAAPDIPGLLANIEYLAVQSGLVLENLQVQSGTGIGPSDPSGQSKKSESKTGTISIDLTVQGRYTQLQAFILNIEKNLRLLDIRGITFGQASSESGDRSYTLQLSTYYQKP